MDNNDDYHCIDHSDDDIDDGGIGDGDNGRDHEGRRRSSFDDITRSLISLL